MPDYRIKFSFWDGSAFHKAGSVVSFAEGTEPRGSVPVSQSQEPDVKAEEKKAIAAAKASAGPKAK